MKLLTTFILAMLIGVSSAFSSDATPERKCIRFVEKARNGSPQFQNQKLPKKAKRKSNQRGEIILTYDVSIKR